MTTIRVRATFETSVEATDAVGRDGQSLTASEYACSVVQSSILLGSERLHGTAVLSVEVIGNAHTEQKGAGR